MGYSIFHARKKKKPGRGQVASLLCQRMPRYEKQVLGGMPKVLFELQVFSSIQLSMRNVVLSLHVV